MGLSVQTLVSSLLISCDACPARDMACENATVLPSQPSAQGTLEAAPPPPDSVKPLGDQRYWMPDTGHKSRMQCSHSCVRTPEPKT